MKNDGKTPSHDVYGNGDQAVVPEYLDKDHKFLLMTWIG